MNSPCLDDMTVLDLAEGRRSVDSAIEAHLASCADCRVVLAAAARGGGQTIRTTEDFHDEEPAWDEIGSGVVIGKRYTLERFLGAGSMGVVWAAERDDGVRVALKIARGRDAALFRRFEREAKVTAALDHPNIIGNLDVLPATDARGTVLVMPLLVGESLETRIAREPTLGLSEAARIIVPIANALSAAHARGIVHRDLKPQNVFLTKSRVMVLDFGIAKLLASWGPHSQLTGSGGVVGTPRYMAPEQIFGDSNVDARADVWATGALLFRLLTGQTPVRGETVGAIIRELRRDSIDDVTMHRRELPGAVVDLIRNALVVSKEQRLASIDGFVDALAGFYRAEP